MTDFLYQLLNDPNFLVNTLRDLPMWQLHIISFCSMFLIDVFYVFWMIKVAERKKWIAGFHSTSLFFCNVIAFTGILEIYNVLMYSGGIGVYFGTVGGIALDNFLRKHKKNTKVLSTTLLLGGASLTLLALSLIPHYIFRNA